MLPGNLGHPVLLLYIKRQPGDDRLQNLEVSGWPIWTKEAAEFPWTYNEPETCYLLEGEVTVTCPDGETASFGQGDLVTFPKGLSCTWKISQDVKKHYRFG